MAPDTNELHLELLLGKRVRDSNGCMAGRIEEFRAEIVDGEWVITEVHLGTAAWLERLAIAVGKLPILSRVVRRSGNLRCARWDQLSLEDRDRPSALVPREQLRIIQP